MPAIDSDRIRPLFPAAGNVLYLDAGLQTPLSYPAIAASQVMFHNGQLNDIASIAGFAAQRGIAVVLDPMQAVGVVPLDVRALGVTALASGTHKGLLIPQGLGFIWTGQPREELPPTYVANSSLASARADYVPSAGSMEFLPTAKRFEIGNLNIPGIYALGGALDLINSVAVENVAEHAYTLGDQLIAGLDRLGVDLVGPHERAHRAPHIYVLALTNPDLLGYFEENGVRVSPERQGIRVSFGMYSTAEDVERFLGILATALEKVPAQAFA